MSNFGLFHRRLAGISSNEEHANYVIVECETSYSFIEETTTIYIVGTVENYMRKIAE